MCNKLHTKFIYCFWGIWNMMGIKYNYYKTEVQFQCKGNGQRDFSAFVI